LYIVKISRKFIHARHPKMPENRVYSGARVLTGCMM
jgi:hypothetical protein